MILIAKILLAIGIFACFGAAIVLILSPLYFVKGYLKYFYHDIIEWHRPSGDGAFYDGCSAMTPVNIAVRTLCRIAREIGFERRE